MESAGLLTAEPFPSRSNRLRQREGGESAGLSGCGVPSCASPCQFVCPQCMVKENPLTVPLVHPKTQVLFVFGEVEWCQNLVRPTQS